MTYDLCHLPPSLKPCEPTDITDTRYLNQNYDSLVNLFKKTLNIELYNKKRLINCFQLPHRH